MQSAAMYQAQSAYFVSKICTECAARRDQVGPQEWAFAWLMTLSEDPFVLRKLIPEAQSLATQYFQELGCSRRRPMAGRLVAALLLAVWQDKEYEPLKARSFVPPSDWIIALIPVVRFLEPALSGYRWLSYEKTCEALQQDRVIMRWASHLEEKQRNEIGSTICSVGKRRYYDYEKEAANRFVVALRETFKEFRTGRSLWEILPSLPRPADAALPNTGSLVRPQRFVGSDERTWPDLLPSLYVMRPRYLRRLREAVSQAAETGGWVTLEGPPGSGKSTLAAALLQQVEDDPDLAARFPNIAFAETSLAPDAPQGLLSKESFDLANRLAAQLEVEIPAPDYSQSRYLSLLKEGLCDVTALIIVDGVAHPDILSWLKDLPAGVVGIAVTWYPEVVEALQPVHRITVGGLEPAEAEELVRKVAGPVPEGQEEAVKELLRAVEYHPLAVRVLAGLSRDTSWTRLRANLLGDPAQRGLTGDILKRVNVVLSEAEERLDPIYAPRLLALGRLPPFAAHDLQTGAALWSVSEDEAQATYEVLVRAGLAENVAQEGPTRYRLHWLIWNYAQGKQPQRPRELFPYVWAWRYALRSVLPHWRWWRSLVPRTKGVWPPWRIPGTEAQKGAMPILRYLHRMGWRSAEGHLQVTPAEYALCMRRALMSWVTLIPATAGGAYFFLLSLWALIRLLAGHSLALSALQLAAWLVTVFLYVLSYIFLTELRRIAWWRARGQTPPPFDHK